MQSRPRAGTVEIVVMGLVFIKQQGPYLNEFKLVPRGLSSDPLLTDEEKQYFPPWIAYRALGRSDLGWENRGDPPPRKVAF